MLLEEIVEGDCSEPSSDWGKETPSAGGDDDFEDNENYLPADQEIPALDLLPNGFIASIERCITKEGKARSAQRAS